MQGMNYASGWPFMGKTSATLLCLCNSICEYDILSSVNQKAMTDACMHTQHCAVWHRLMSNMVIYMTRIMHYDPAFASVQLMLFEGTCYLTPILGAWLADSRWGRFYCILVFSIIYFVVRAACTPSALHSSAYM